MPYKELISLIRKHSGRSLWRVAPLHALTNSTRQIERSEQHGETLFVQCFQNSVVLSSPAVLFLEKIISDSGYIQSCGELLFESPWYNVDSARLIDQLNRCDMKTSRKFVFYTVEEFGLNTPSREGVDGVKFFKNKHYIGNELASHFIARFQRDHLAPNDVVDRVAGYERPNTTADYESIFVIKDSIIENVSSFEKGHITNQQHIIAYHSEYKKENPVHILDDWRPFWPGQYTTPAVLATAALNLVRADESTLFVDPYSGSGGIGVAASSMGFHCALSDLVGAPGIRFNLAFYRDSRLRAQLLSRLRDLTEILKRSETIDSVRLLQLAEEIRSAITTPLMHWNESLDQIVNRIDDFEKMDAFLLYRVFYFNRELLEKAASVELILKRFVSTAQEFVKQVDRAFAIENKLPDPNRPLLRRGKYGALTSGSPTSWGDFVVSTISADQIHNTPSITRLADSASRLVIATDLPYGVNTDIEENNFLNQLYADSFRSAFRLAARTQQKMISFVLFSLQAVKIGKPVPTSAFSNNVRLVLHKVANEFGCMSVKSPFLDEVPSYISSEGYWRSEKALDREIILHEFTLPQQCSVVANPALQGTLHDKAAQRP
ncbi:hypothetical protein [Thioalkalivibrio sp. ALE10]|uniref:hypothetical protein n=1 Tax=Thioalkalivibrio sp. ALE10 TaxID=748651 RepID=UPI0012DC8ADD|nr:hypothetical protein [Thioalkalivibrio sp. ALE10]